MGSVVDLLKLWLWYAVVGFSACGAARFGGYGTMSTALEAFPRPRPCGERQLRRDFARGLAEIEAYLGEQRPTPGRKHPHRSTGGDAQ